MEPDIQDDEMPEPTGVTINLNPDRVIAALQRRAANLTQNLQWELATRDAVVEVLEERLRESEQLREEAEGAIEQYVADALESARDLEEARKQIGTLTREDAFLMADTVVATEGLGIAKRG